MAQKYLEQLIRLMKGVEVGKSTRLECKHFFRGAACWVNDRIFISFSPVGIALKLPVRYRKELTRENGATPLRYFPRAPIKKEYVVLPKQIIANNEALKNLIQVSVDYVLS